MKSFNGSYGRFFKSAALYAWALVLTSNVYPSAGDFATCAGPAVAPAPATFSTVTRWPQNSVSVWASATNQIGPSASPERLDQAHGLRWIVVGSLQHQSQRNNRPRSHPSRHLPSVQYSEP